MTLSRLAVVAAIALAAFPSFAGELRMEMRNNNGTERFVYVPDFVRIRPGDTVVFDPVDKGHNAVSIDGMGASDSIRINVGFSKKAAITFDKPGIYGVKCTPHVGLGMVGVIVVGDVTVSDSMRKSVSKLPLKARHRIEKIFDQSGQS